jgi:hypothetical protein
VRLISASVQYPHPPQERYILFYLLMVYDLQTMWLRASVKRYDNHSDMATAYF